MDIRILKIISAIIAFSAMIPFALLAEEITVGSCPSKIVLERLGEWAVLSNDEITVEILNSNPNRTNDVAAAFMVDDSSGLEVVLLTLHGLDKFQGRIGENDFNALRSNFAEAFQGPSPELQSKIDRVMEGNFSGTGSTGFHLSYEPGVSTPGKFIGFAVTEMSIPGSETKLYETAMKMQHIRGCVVQANFSIALSPGSRERLNRAIADFVLR